MSNVSRIIIEVDGSSFINKVIYMPESGRQEIVTIANPANPIEHQIPPDVFIALLLAMSDFVDKEGNESAGAAVSLFIRTHRANAIKAVSEWAGLLVRDLTDAQKDALYNSLAIDDIG